jgi:hypothetical protein
VLGASFYVPIDIHDTRYGEKPLWNLSASGRLGSDLSAYASLTGTYKGPQPIRAAEAGLSYKGVVSLGAYGHQLNGTAPPNYGIKLSADFPFGGGR